MSTDLTDCPKVSLIDHRLKIQSRSFSDRELTPRLLNEGVLDLVLGFRAVKNHWLPCFSPAQVNYGETVADDLVWFAWGLVVSDDGVAEDLRQELVREGLSLIEWERPAYGGQRVFWNFRPLGAQFLKFLELGQLLVRLVREVLSFGQLGEAADCLVVNVDVVFGELVVLEFEAFALGN